MIIKSIHIKHFRCIFDEILNCEPLTAIVGANGAGKSSFLRALELFYSSSPHISLEDYYNNDINEDIEIGVIFTELGESAKEQFAAYLDGEELAVTRVLSMREGKYQPNFMA